MALPLLAAIGLGMAGGVGFLQKRSDERKAETMLRNFEPGFAGLDAAHRNAEWQNEVNNLLEGDVGFFNSKAEMAQSLLDRYDTAIEADQARIQQGIETQNALNRTAIDDLREVMEPAAIRYDKAQSNVRKAEELLQRAADNEGEMANLDLQEFIWLIADMREPGLAKTRDEIEGVIATMPALTRFWQKANFGGTANKEDAEVMYRLLREGFQEQQRQYREVVASRDQLERSYFDQGASIDPRQYKGLWGVKQGYEPRAYQDIIPSNFEVVED